jgi:valyl-tRNA synthetase
VTGRDIIFLWVARMVMMGIEFTGELPFTDVPINSIIQAPDGRRMSKSLGTGIDPLDIVGGGERPPVFEQGGEFPAYGADGLRFGLLAMSSSQDVRFNEERVKQGADLANKLWNASRLVLLRVEDLAAEPRTETVEDRWIVSRLERLTERVTELYESFAMSHAALELYEGFWTDVCDWYLELVKPRLYGETPPSATLLWVLERTLTLLHPIMPFVTEEIWSYMPGERGLLAASAWPAPDRSLIDEEAEELVGAAIATVTELRRYRDEAGVPARATLRARISAEAPLRGHIARLARVEFTDDGDGAVATVGPVEVLPSEGISAEDQAARVEARRSALEAEIARAEGKLANDGFVKKAPSEVVDREREKLERFRAELESL